MRGFWGRWGYGIRGFNAEGAEVWGMVATWQSVGGQLLISGLATLSVCQDIGMRIWGGVVFSSLIAMAFGFSVLVTATRAELAYAPGICVVVFC